MMQRLMIQAEPELIDRAKRRARERGVSVAQVVREALARDLTRNAEPPPVSIIGMFSSEAGDLSERAGRDEYKPPPWRS